MAVILITGGTGRLGRKLVACLRLIEGVVCIAPDRSALDVLSPEGCAVAIDRSCPDVVIHCAGFVNTFSAESEHSRCWQLNVEGTRNVARASRPARFVYVSTDYVFDGVQGNFAESDVPAPVNYYGLTKLVGEAIALEHPNSLVLRAPFRDDPPWAYPRAFADQWTSCDFVSVRAPQVAAAALGAHRGILHIGGERRSILAMARAVSPVVQPMMRSEVAVRLPRDTSLDSSLWHSLIEASGRQSLRAETSISAR